MRAPRFAESPNESRITGFEKNQDRIQAAHRPNPVENPWELRQVVSLAHVDDDGHFFHATVSQRQLRQGRDQRRRKIVDAEIPEIFERAYGLRLSGTREPGQTNKRLVEGASNLRHVRRRRSTGGRSAPKTSIAWNTFLANGPHREPPGSSSSSSSSSDGIRASRSVCSSRAASSRVA